jgi:glycosyltransferase involved in cell wall biosynthesis
METVGVAIPSIPPREKYLKRALASVNNQTRAPEQISVSVDTQRRGAAPTRNAAASQLHTDWIAFLDDDDVLYPKHLESLLRTAHETSADLVYPWFDLHGGPDPLAVPDQHGNLVNPFGIPFTESMRDYLSHRANFIPVTYIVRRDLFDAVGGFPTPGEDWWQHTECEDWGFLIAVAHTGANIVHHPERTWVWNHHGRNTSGRTDRW